MKLFSSLHNPASKRYAIYYSTIIIIVCGTVGAMHLDVVNLSVFETAAIYFEGFFSLFMLIRNNQIGNAFLQHLKSTQIIMAKLSFT